MANSRAGVAPHSDAFRVLVKGISASESIGIYGFYCHSGNAYASTSLSQASNFLSAELDTVNAACKIALELIAPEKRPERYVLSVGSTPTAHAAASSETREKLKALLHGELEIHAGQLFAHFRN